MSKRGGFAGVAVRSAVLGAVLLGGWQGTVAQPQRVEAPVAAETPSPERLAETREQLLAYLRMSPTLAMVVASDASLLADKEYVSRSNPELAHFLDAHPEIARNPEFYLFGDIPVGRGRRVEALERRMWPDRSRDSSPELRDFLNMMAGAGAFLAFLGAFLWLIRTLIDNRRWGRIFKMQSEVHSRLIERFGNNEELLQYMGTDAGKRFLEAAPIPVDFDRDRRVPAALSRVLVPLQIGVVLTLLGTGLLFLRHSLPEIAAPLLVFGVVILMPGLGLILSAGITWFLAGRLGLIPKGVEETADQGGRL